MVTKRICISILLFFIFLTGCSFSPTTKSKTINSVTNLNIENADYVAEWGNMKQELNIQGVAKIESFRLAFNQSGEITRFDFSIIDKHESFLVHKVKLNLAEENYNFTTTKIDNWLQFDRLVDTENFFWALSNIEFDNLPDRSSDYLIYSSGKLVSYADDSKENYLITSSGLVKISNGTLPLPNIMFFLPDWSSKAFLHKVE